MSWCRSTFISYCFYVDPITFVCVSLVLVLVLLLHQYVASLPHQQTCQGNPTHLKFPIRNRFKRWCQILPLSLPQILNKINLQGNEVSPLPTLGGFTLVKLGDPLGNFCHICLILIRNHKFITCFRITISDHLRAESLDKMSGSRPPKAGLYRHRLAMGAAGMLELFGEPPRRNSLLLAGCQGRQKDLGEHSDFVAPGRVVLKGHLLIGFR